MMLTRGDDDQSLSERRPSPVSDWAGCFVFDLLFFL